MNSQEQALFLTLYYLDDTSLARACQVNKKFYQKVCTAIWLNRIRERFPDALQDLPEIIQQKTPYEQYKLLIDLDQIKTTNPRYKNISFLKLYQAYQLKNKNGKYYNFWEGEISGQLSDGMWGNEPYEPGESNFTDVMDYLSDRLLFLGVATRLGLNIKDDPWIQNISWIFFKGVDIIEYIKTHDLDAVLNDYLAETTAKGDKYWIDRAQEMIQNKDKMKLIWDYIQSGQYNYDTLYEDLDEFNSFYVQNISYYFWRL